MSLADRIRLPVLNLIHRRPRLLNLLTNFVDAAHRLITISAPGGYGKSIALADFAQTTDLPVCWCSLNAADRDPTLFLSLLTYSITDRFREIDPDPLFKVIEQGDTQAGVRRLAGELADVGPHLIIIDDYHKATSAGTTLALNYLLEKLPDNSTVIVAAREDMPLETGQIIDLLISERAAGLSEEELRFNGEEIQRVMRKRFGRWIDLPAAQEIARTTDGNIAQILLIGHMQSHLGAPSLTELQQRLGDDQAVIYDYLAREVLGKLPADFQDFMIRTAVLPELTVELCNNLLEISEAQFYLHELVHRDMFITQLGAGFKYHDLFAEFLRTTLANTLPEYRQLVIKAAALLAGTGNGNIEEAMTLYLSVQAWSEAAQLFEEKGMFLYETGRALTLNQWLNQIPQAELASYPRLLLLYGQIHTEDRGAPEQAMKYYQQAEERFFAQQNFFGTAETQILKSAALRMMGRATESLTLAETGYRQLEALQADRRLMAHAMRHLGIAHGFAGNIDDALASLRQALELYQALDDRYRVGMCHHDIGICLEKQGNTNNARDHYQQAIRIWEILGNDTRLANALNSLGVCRYATGHYDEALQHLNDSLNIALQINAPRRAAFAQAGIGDVYLRLGQYNQAAEAYANSSELAQSAQVHSLELYNLIREGECAYGENDMATALIRAGRARNMASESGLDYELGLACALQARIYVRQADYENSFPLFTKALTCLSRNDVLEQIRVHLWYGYGLLLDYQTQAASNQLQQATRLARTVGDLLPGLEPCLDEVRPLFQYFLHHATTPEGVKESITFLLSQIDPATNDTPNSLIILTFGPPALVINQERKQFNQRGGIRKMPEFLLFLLLQGQNGGCRWSEVSAALWPEEDGDRASTLFHQYLKRLRSVIRESSVSVTLQDDYYQLTPSTLIWCDAQAFDALFERAAHADAQQALALRLAMIDLYQGDFLDGFELTEWGTGYRTDFEIRFLQTVGLAAEQLLQNASPEEALIVIKKGLARDYTREELHRAALRAYAQLGMFDDLTAHYAQLCHNFDQEFGLLPSRETQALYDQMTDVRLSA